MPLIDLVDEFFVAAPAGVVAARLADPAPWRLGWPELDRRVILDRGTAGVQWRIGGVLTGTAEVWLEPVLDGVLVHCYLRADPPPPRTLSRRSASRLARDYGILVRRLVNAVKDDLEAGRPPGVPPVQAAPATPAEPGAASETRMASETTTATGESRTARGLPTRGG